MKRERLRVVANEPVGPYTLLRLDRGGLDAGIPGQFFMLEPPGRLLPRPMSLCLAPVGELGFLIDPIGPGTRALCAARPGDEIGVLGPLGNGFDNVLSGRKSAVVVCAEVTLEKPRKPPLSVVGRKYRPMPPRKTIGFRSDSLYATPTRG